MSIIIEKYWIEVGPRSAKELIAAGGYDTVRKFVRPSRFRNRIKESGRVELALVRFGNAALNSAYAIERAEAAGMERCQYEDAFFCGEQHPGLQVADKLAFLHKPVIVKGEAYVLALGRNPHAIAPDWREISLVPYGGGPWPWSFKLVFRTGLREKL